MKYPKEIGNSIMSGNSALENWKIFEKQIRDAATEIPPVKAKTKNHRVQCVLKG